MLQLRDIYLGSTDAKNEVLSNDPLEVERFLSSYVTPPTLDIERFARREKYYVSGLKGTGKTALLRFIALRLQDEGCGEYAFTLFKSDVDEELRKDFARAARVQVSPENSADFEGDDFELIWRWFIYRKIAEARFKQNHSCFQENALFQRFLAIVNSESPDQLKSPGLVSLVPIIRKGHIEISRSPKLGFELSWDNEGRGKIKFAQLVRRADEAFEQLQGNGARLNLFFDELELNYATAKQYERDSRLVRDLIVSIEKLNSTAKRLGFGLCLYGAVRSEVLNSVASLGKEINKPMTDFGVEILWNTPGRDATQQPLLAIIDQRINNARRQNDLSELSSHDLWENYFPAEIHRQKPQTYLLHNSWYRPRDIVRLLLSAQEQYPDQERFDVQALEAVRKKYSSGSWVEMAEELKAKYKARDIEGIKCIFYGFRQIATIAELVERADEVAKDHEETGDLLKRCKVQTILKDLFRVGIIGNIDSRRERMRFSFRGDDELLFDQDIFVHNALRAHLSIST